MTVILILLGAAGTLAASCACGLLVLARTRLRLDREERWLLALPIGAACWSTAVFLLGITHMARKGVFVALIVALIVGVIAAAWRSGAWRSGDERREGIGRRARLLFAAVYGTYCVLYAVHAIAPEASPDGAAYHLGLVAQYNRAHGLVPLGDNMYSNLSAGFEMLFWSAFAIGRHSAAAVVHAAFLAWLPLAMLFWARRQGAVWAGVTGGLLVFCAPVAGIDGISAYNDAGVAAVLFALFYVVTAWDGRPESSPWLEAGLLSGFAFAIKYTAFLAVPFALAVLVLRTRKLRGAGLPGLAAAAMMAPWLIKNYCWTGNPFSPLLNAWFPNPMVHISMEQSLAGLRRYGLADLRVVPWEVTVHGLNLSGFFGPVFLLAPLALFTRQRLAWVLLGAWLFFTLPYPANIGTRFLIPGIPFLALALGMRLGRWPVAAAGVVLVHAILSWPGMMTLYCHEAAWRLDGFPLRAALRLEPEDAFLSRQLYGYTMARALERLVGPRDRVFAMNQLPEAYTTRHLTVWRQSAEGELLGDILLHGVIGDYPPGQSRRFRFAPTSPRRLRIVQTAGGTDLWSIHEIHALRDGKEVRLTGVTASARPNPWDAGLALDGNPVTRWRTWEPIRAAMFFELRFPEGFPPIDELRVDGSSDQWQTQIRLEALGGNGPSTANGTESWITIAPQPQDVTQEISSGSLRGQVAATLRQRGITHLLLADSDFGAVEIRDHASEWGVRCVYAEGGVRLYALQKQ